MIKMLLGYSAPTLLQFCHIVSPFWTKEPLWSGPVLSFRPPTKKILLKALSFMTTVNISLSAERGFTVQKHQCDS